LDYRISFELSWKLVEKPLVRMLLNNQLLKNRVKLVCYPFNTEHSSHMILLHIIHNNNNNNAKTMLHSLLAILVGIPSHLDILPEIPSSPLAINLEIAIFIPREIASLAILPGITSHLAILVEIVKLDIQLVVQVVGIPARRLKQSSSPLLILNSGVQRRCVTGC